MSRIPPKKNVDYPWYLRLFFFFMGKKYGVPPEPLLLWGRTPRVMRNFLMTYRALNRKSSPLDPQLRALVSVKVSQINSCAYCVDMNASLLLQHGGGEEKIKELQDFASSLLFSAKEKAALQYAVAMTQSSSKIGDAIFNELKHHFNDDTIVELTALIAFQNMSSKFNAALDVSAFGFCKTS